MAFPTTGVLSSFTGADENPISEGGNWITDPFGVGNPPMQRVSNALSGSETTGADCESGYDAASYGPDSEVYVTMPTKGPSGGAWLWLGLRGDFAAKDGYFVAWITSGGTDTQRIYRKDAGVDTQLGATNTSAFTDGDQLGFEAIGSTLTVYKNGAAVFSRTDATHSGAGKLFVSADNTTVRMDDFSGGTVAAAQTLLPGKVATSVALHGANLSPSGSAPLLAGKLSSSVVVHGVNFDPVSATLLAGKVSSSETVHGVTLAAAGHATLLSGKIASTATVRGVRVYVGIQTESTDTLTLTAEGANTLVLASESADTLTINPE